MQTWNVFITLTVITTASARPLAEANQADPGEPGSKDCLLQDYIQLTRRDDNLLAAFCVYAGWLGFSRPLLVIMAFEAVWAAAA